jgi:eukaryotic-like serine/threonine-protein kinase
LQGKLINFFRALFYISVVIAAGFISFLVAMRFAIRGGEVDVPSVMGKTVLSASDVLNTANLRLKVEAYRFDDQTAGDLILHQDPSPGYRLKLNRTVRVIVSLGAKKVMVPDLRGESLRASQITLLKRGLTLGVTSALFSESVEKDLVVSQDPLPQTQLAQSPVVNLLISQGRKTPAYLMPELVGMNLEEVLKAIEPAGVKAGKFTYQAMGGVARGTILKQYLPPGSRLGEGDSLDLEVSR